MEPSAELRAKANPYDWANVRLWFWDASYYKGHYYLYWGPLPALGIAVAKTVFRINREVGDQYPLFVGYIVLLIAGALLIERMARRLFPAIPYWFVLLSIGVFAYANPTPYMIATPGIYEAAIVDAQAFLLLGVLFAFEAIWRGKDGPTPRRYLVMAGTSWVLAIACRISAGPPTALLCLATALFAPAGDRGVWRRRARDLLWVAAPVAVGSALLLAYNKARFDAWFEFGIGYQLNTMPMKISSKYLALNLHSYLLRPIGASCRFPFVAALRNVGPRGFPAGMAYPPEYMTGEPVVGIWSSAPWSWMVVIAIVLTMARPLRRWIPAAAPADAPPADPFATRSRWWCLACFGILATVPLLPIAAGIGATMRYLADVSTGIVLVAIWGLWWLIDRLRDRVWPRRAVIAGAVLLALATVVLGVLLGFTGYDDMFKWHNPRLYERLTRALSFCGR